MIGYPIVYRVEDSHTISIVGTTGFMRPTEGSAEIVVELPIPDNDWSVPNLPEESIEHEGDPDQMKSRQLTGDTLLAYGEYDLGTRVHFSDLSFKLNEQINQADTQPEKRARTVISMNFLKEYMSRDRRHVFYVLEWTVSRNLNFPPVCFALLETSATIPLPPPDLA